MSAIFRISRRLGVDEWCEGAGRANQLIGNLLFDADEWCNHLARGIVRLPLDLTLYTKREHERQLACLLDGLGVPRSRMGPRLLVHLSPNPDQRPTLRIVS